MPLPGWALRGRGRPGLQLAVRQLLTPLAATRLSALLALTSGREDVLVAVLDGPVAAGHPDLAGARLRFPDGGPATGGDGVGLAVRHGTFVTGLLLAAPTSVAPGACPGCTVLVRPIYRADADGRGATPNELAEAIASCVAAGARIINISGAIPAPAIAEVPALRAALDEAARRGVLVVAAAGNRLGVGGTPITLHPWVIVTVPFRADRRPVVDANLGRSIGR